jgi:hypothetical protein
MNVFIVIIASYLISLPAYSQQSGMMSDCEKEYRERAKAKKDKLSRQMERYLLGTWINLNGHYVRLEDQGGNPQDYYNNFEEDILQIHAQAKNLNSGAQEITTYVNKKIKADSEDLKRAIHFGFVTGDLCKKSFGVKNRKQTARYIIQHLSELQAITHSTSTKVIDDLVEKENESGRNSDIKSDSVTDK